MPGEQKRGEEGPGGPGRDAAARAGSGELFAGAHGWMVPGLRLLLAPRKLGGLSRRSWIGSCRDVRLAAAQRGGGISRAKAVGGG